MSAGSPERDVEQSSDAALVELISGGSVPAFVTLVARTSESARAELAEHLPGAGRAGEVLAASYLEVWWLAGCHRAPDVGVADWIIGIVRRRIADTCRMSPCHGELPAVDDPRPSYAELEFAALLRRPVNSAVRAASARADSPDR